MRKILIPIVLVGVAVFTAVSVAKPGSDGGFQAQVPGEAKTLDAHPATTAQGKALGVDASAKGSQFGLRYLFADLTLAPGETSGGAIKCPKKWHPISGLFFTASDGVTTASDAPVSTRKWGIFVFNQATTEAMVTVGAVCEKGLPLTGAG